jgi:putative colanic acid biosynthesis acetyltransferase WcaF
MSLLKATDTNPREGGPSFSLGHRVYRAVWAVVWLVFASWTPPQFKAWRRILLRAFGARIARGANVAASARVWYPANLDMGPFSTLAPKVDCYCMAKISLADYALVSQGAFLCAGTHDVDDPDFQLITRPIAIGREAWVAAQAFVGPGVSIGEGAVLGARGVATKDLDPWTVYAGNPAIRIRQRRRSAAG